MRKQSTSSEIFRSAVLTYEKHSNPALNTGGAIGQQTSDPFHRKQRERRKPFDSDGRFPLKTPAPILFIDVTGAFGIFSARSFGRARFAAIPRPLPKASPIYRELYLDLKRFLQQVRLGSTHFRPSLPGRKRVVH